MMMMNQRPARCRECGRELLAGEGEWRRDAPHWGKAGYVCAFCSPIWTAAGMLAGGLAEDYDRCRQWVAERLPGWEVAGMQGGWPALLDYRAAAQDVIHQAIYEGTGLWARAVARNLAEYFERDIVYVGEWREGVERVRTATLRRLEGAVIWSRQASIRPEEMTTWNTRR